MTNPVQLIRLRHFGDARGWFTEVYSVPAFTLRGLYFQMPPRG